jgi:hypothetical protein
MTPYEERALKEIHAWKNPELGWFGQAMRAINQPLDKSADFLLGTPKLGDVIRLSIQGLTSVCNDLAQWTIQKKAIYNDFRKAGHTSINKEADVFEIEIEDVDKIVGWLDAKYKGIALVPQAVRL